MTRTEFMQKIKTVKTGELKSFLDSMSEQEWKDPDLCIVDGGINAYWWPNILDEGGHPKGLVIG